MRRRRTRALFQQFSSAVRSLALSHDAARRLWWRNCVVARNVSPKVGVADGYEHLPGVRTGVVVAIAVGNRPMLFNKGNAFSTQWHEPDVLVISLPANDHCDGHWMNLMAVWSWRL